MTINDIGFAGVIASVVYTFALVLLSFASDVYNFPFGPRKRLFLILTPPLIPAIFAFLASL